VLIIRAYVNLDEIDAVGIQNTGVTNDCGEYKYRIAWPKQTQDKYKKLRVWHDRSESWHSLAAKFFKKMKEDCLG